MTSTSTEEQIRRLEKHLKRENPVLAGAVNSFRRLDKVAHKIGLAGEEESYANKVSWWPVISVLGTFSAGKSTFINRYTGYELQRTGNQAVDDKFTVICYGPEPEPRVLPGIALDGDPRFPFYQISRSIEEVAAGEGRRVDSYLQLRTCSSPRLQAKIFIDSPGFDADAQRSSTLVITDHIMDLSDLVLIFFDARRPEPGAMGDTLEHLVTNTINRPDANKFLYILNQIDNAAREDNSDEVFAAWQRALAQHGLTAGRFYQIYDPECAVPIEDGERRRRFEVRRDADLGEIYDRVRQVEVERAYRVIGVLEKTTKRIRDDYVPRLEEARASWRKSTLVLDAIVFGGGGLAVIAGSVQMGFWEGASASSLVNPLVLGGLIVALVALAYLHQGLRRLAAIPVTRRLRRDESLDDGDDRDALVRAFRANVAAWWHGLGAPPVGWNRRSRREVERVLAEAKRFIQELNDRYTDPSGEGAPAATGKPLGATRAEGADAASPDTRASQATGRSEGSARAAQSVAEGSGAEHR